MDASPATVDTPEVTALRGEEGVRASEALEKASPPAAGTATVGVWLRALRWKQWVKNVLLFLPFIFSHEWEQIPLIWDALSGFGAFCAGASGVYLLNDLLDQAADQAHAVKRHRPLAAGLISRRAAWIMSCLLLLLGGIVAGGLSSGFFTMYALYVISAGAYSVWLKQIMLLDAMMLAGFYALRLFAGSLATRTPVSNWLLLFSLFFFLGLAFQKRLSELRGWQDGTGPLRRRGYVKADLEHMNSMGTSASYLSVMVLALYIQSPEVMLHYGQPGVLWWIVPCLLYWLSRLWLLAGRDEVTEDAISFAIKDRVSYAVIAVVIIVVLLAKPI